MTHRPLMKGQIAVRPSEVVYNPYITKWMERLDWMRKQGHIYSSQVDTWCTGVPLTNSCTSRAKHDTHDVHDVLISHRTEKPAAVISKSTRRPTTLTAKISTYAWLSTRILTDAMPSGCSNNVWIQIGKLAYHLSTFVRMNSVVLAMSACAAVQRILERKTSVALVLKNILNSDDLTKFGHNVWRDAASTYAIYDAKICIAVDVETPIYNEMWTTKLPKQNRFQCHKGLARSKCLVDVRLRRKLLRED